MKRALCLALALLCLLSLCGCAKYTSSYRAMMLVRSNTAHTAKVSFSTLTGKMAFTLKPKAGGDARITAKCDLQSGSATVYVDDGEKTEWFKIAGGEEVQLQYGPCKSGKVYVILETGEKCREGHFQFETE